MFVFDSDESGKFSNNCYYSSKGKTVDATFKSYNTDGLLVSKVTEDFFGNAYVRSIGCCCH